MRCPNCASTKVRRSIREGFKEGLFLRLVLRAPYRCTDCGTRFMGFSRNREFRRRKRRRSVAEFLGFRGIRRQRFNRIALVLVLSAVLIAIATMLVLRLSQPTTPADVP